MNYFIQAVANNLNAKCSFLCPYSKQFACFSLNPINMVLKTGILFWGIYSKFIKHNLQLYLNVGKQEISFPASIF